MFICETDDEYPIGSNSLALFISGLIFRIFSCAMDVFFECNSIV